MKDWFEEMLHVLIHRFVLPEEFAQAEQAIDIVLEVCKRTFNKHHDIDFKPLYQLVGIKQNKLTKTALYHFGVQVRLACYYYAVNSTATEDKIDDYHNSVSLALSNTARALDLSSAQSDSWTMKKIIQVAIEIERILRQQRSIIKQNYHYFSLDVRLNVLGKFLELLSIAEILPLNKDFSVLHRAMNLNYDDFYKLIHQKWPAHTDTNQPLFDFSFTQLLPVYMSVELIRLIRTAKPLTEQHWLSAVANLRIKLEPLMLGAIFDDEMYIELLKKNYQRMFAIPLRKRSFEETVELITDINYRLGGSLKDRLFYQKYREQIKLSKEPDNKWSGKTFGCFFLLFMIIYLNQDERFNLQAKHFSHPLLQNIDPDLMRPLFLEHLTTMLFKMINHNIGTNLQNTGRFFSFRTKPEVLHALRSECLTAKTDEYNDFLETIQNTFDREKITQLFFSSRPVKKGSDQEVKTLSI